MWYVCTLCDGVRSYYQSISQIKSHSRTKKSIHQNYCAVTTNAATIPVDINAYFYLKRSINEPIDNLHPSLKLDSKTVKNNPNSNNNLSLTKVLNETNTNPVDNINHLSASEYNIATNNLYKKNDYF